MKIEPFVTVNCSTNQVEFPQSGDACAVFRANGVDLLHLRRTTLDSFPENRGLPEKLRKHIAGNNIAAEINSSNIIPFGCEYQIDRHWKVAGNLCELTTDIAALHGGKIKELFLEELFFPVKKDFSAEFLVFGEKSFRKTSAPGIAYDGNEPILMFRVISPEGKVEFYAGDDLWRHRCAEQIPGAESRHTVEINENGITCSRLIFHLPEDAEPEKRPWRFKSIFAIAPPEKTFCGKNQPQELSLSNCSASPAVHRELRSFVRKQKNNSSVLFRGDFPQICSDGAHLSRPGKKCLHSDLGEVFNEWLWANGVLQKKGGVFTAESRNTLFDSSVILNVMQSPAMPLSIPEDL